VLLGYSYNNTATVASSFTYALEVGSSTTGIVLKNCIMRAPGAALLIYGGPVTVINCLCLPATMMVYSVPTEISINTVRIQSAGIATFYNSLFIAGSGGTGFTSSGTVTAINCYASGSTSYGNSGTLNLTTSASADTSGSTGLQSIAYSTVNFTSVTAGSENFALTSGSSLIGAGTNEYSTFTTDIIGTPRQSSGAWDVGSFAYNSGGYPNYAVCSTCSFTTLASAISDIATNHAVLTNPVTVNISGTWASADTTSVSITGITTTATNTLSIYTSGSAVHPGYFQMRPLIIG